MISDPQSPWQFQRDEVDLLEEDIDDIYRVYQSLDGEVKNTEQAIILEQLETEERAEAEFTLQMDLRWLMKQSSGKSVWENSLKEEKFDEENLSCDAGRSPFYEQVFLFAERVFVYAEVLHQQGGDTIEHAFRIRLNVKMVPIKCAIAMSEESHDDEMSIALAKKEYTLALVYLERVLISLAFLAANGDDHAKAFLAPGIQMQQILQQHFLRINNSRRGFVHGYE